MTERVISYVQAVASGETHYFTGELCRRGHIAQRLVSKKRCVECHAADFDKWRRNNLDRMREHNRAYALAHPEVKAARTKRLTEAGAVARYKRNARAKKVEAYRVAEAAKAARCRRAEPPWADRRAIRAFYTEAKRRTRITGIPHSVDHIIPLFGKNVCGLHVQTNLRVITVSENSRKLNHYE